MRPGDDAEFRYKSSMQVPAEKIIVNMGLVKLPRTLKF
jgi:hypothetical protein